MNREIKFKNPFIYLPLIGFFSLFLYDFLIFFINSQQIVFYKTIYFLLLLIIVGIGFLKKSNASKQIKITFFPILFFSFVFFYFLRLVFDLYMAEIYHSIYTSKLTYLIIYTYLTLIVWFIVKDVEFNYSVVSKSSLLIGVFYTILSCISIYNNFSLEVRVDATRGIDPIAFGHMGVIILSFALHLLLNKKEYVWQFIGLIFLFIGSLVIVLSASKGPFLAASIVVLIFSFYSFRKFFYFLLLIFLGSLYFPIFSEIDSTLFYQRVLSASNYSDETRSTLISQGISEFLSSPIVGSSFLLKENSYKGEYVHNILVESFMATGLLGGGVFITIIFMCFKYVFFLLKTSRIYFFYSLFFIDSVIYGFVSRSLINLSSIWISIIIIYYLYRSLDSWKGK